MPGIEGAGRAVTMVAVYSTGTGTGPEISRIEPHAAALAIVVRIERTGDEFARLGTAITDWIADAETEDTRQQHRTQRAAIEADLTGALAELKATLDGIDAIDRNATGTATDTAAATAAATAASVYEACRELDQSLVLLRQLWAFYADKLDQRRDAQRLGPLLLAADELVWSCHRQAMERAALSEPAHRKRPAPLVFVAADYSPAAFESDKPLHAELGFRSTVAALEPFLDNPAIPVLRLPPWCVDDPWWLAFIPHEVGHHVLHDLDLVRFFREGIEQAVERAGAAKATVAQWGSWGQEIFADLYSVLMIGPAALRALVEIEWARPDAMNRPRGSYPPALVRLELMARFAEAHGMAVTAALPLGRPAQTPQVALHWPLIDAVVAFAQTPLRDGLGGLRELCGFGSAAELDAWFGPQGQVARLARQLGEAPPAPAVARHLSRPRQVAAAALSAWSTLVGTDSAAELRAARLDHLRAATLATLQVSGPEGTRAGQVQSPRRGAALGRGLLAASRRQLGEKD